MESQNYEYGFVGVGTIANAVIRGIIEAKLNKSKIYLSPRGTDRVNCLVDELSNAVVKCQDNQSVVDKSQWVFIGVLPRQTEEVVSALNFRPEQIIVSMVSTATHDQLFAWCKNVPRENIVRVIPLPAVEHLSGTSLVFPPHPLVKNVFDHLGAAVGVSCMEEFNRLIVITCTMGDIYERLHVMQEWLCREGAGQVDPAKAGIFISSVFKTFIDDAVVTCKTNPSSAFAELVAEQTPGGINEFVISNQRANGAYEILNGSLNAVHEKVSKK